jgi:hypothetical protein
MLWAVAREHGHNLRRTLRRQFGIAEPEQLPAALVNKAKWFLENRKPPRKGKSFFPKVPRTDPEPSRGRPASESSPPRPTVNRLAAITGESGPIQPYHSRSVSAVHVEDGNVCAWERWLSSRTRKGECPNEQHRG